jgi:hypothetical protein
MDEKMFAFKYEVSSNSRWMLLALIAPVASARNAPLDVTFDQLTSHPQRYSGKRIAVVAYYDIDSAEHSSYLANRPNTEFSALPHIFVDLPRWISDTQTRSAAKRRVKIIGTFEYRDISKKKVISEGDATHPGIIQTTLGFGWMGIYDKQITKLSEFTVVREK